MIKALGSLDCAPEAGGFLEVPEDPPESPPPPPPPHPQRNRSCRHRIATMNLLSLPILLLLFDRGHIARRRLCLFWFFDGPCSWGRSLGALGILLRLALLLSLLLGLFLLSLLFEILIDLNRDALEISLGRRELRDDLGSLRVQVFKLKSKDRVLLGDFETLRHGLLELTRLLLLRGRLGGLTVLLTHG